jgi:hypothetical protein
MVLSCKIYFGVGSYVDSPAFSSVWYRCILVRSKYRYTCVFCINTYGTVNRWSLHFSTFGNMIISYNNKISYNDRGPKFIQTNSGNTWWLTFHRFRRIRYIVYWCNNVRNTRRELVRMSSAILLRGLMINLLVCGTGLVDLHPCRECFLFLSDTTLFLFSLFLFLSLLFYSFIYTSPVQRFNAHLINALCFFFSTHLHI